jgi:hypothetical protein
MIPAIKFPRTVVELKAMAALMMIPRKLRICPFRFLSMGNDKIKVNMPVRMSIKEMVPCLILFESWVDFIVRKIHAFKTKANIRRITMPVEAKMDCKMAEESMVVYVLVVNSGGLVFF